MSVVRRICLKVRLPITPVVAKETTPAEDSQYKQFYYTLKLINFLLTIKHGTELENFGTNLSFTRQ
jgi:hypothetical protein